MALTTDKRFDQRATVDTATFYNAAGEARVNIEGIVEVSGVSDINVDNTTVNTGGGYVGKSADGTDADFTVAYASPTTLTLSSYPAGISGFSATDIETVRHIDDATGLVTATYSRDDAAMSITTNTLTITGAVFTAADYFVIQTNVPRASSAGASGAGGGSIVYTNAAGDFTAVANNATKTVTITGLPFTLDDIHVVGGTIIKISTDGTTLTLAPTTTTVAAGVITYTGIDDFVTTDTVYVTLIGPDKWYDNALDNALVNVQNPNYAHYTDTEILINEADLGITDTATGTDTNTLTDTNHTIATIDFDAEQVAVGYEAYSEGEDTAATVNSITDGDNIETDAIVDWTGDVYWLPECKRFEIPMEGYRFLSIHAKLVTGDVNNVAYMKLYATNNVLADTTDDTDWVDVSTSVLGAAQISATNTTTEGIYFVDTSTIALKFMIKIVGEVMDGGAAAAADNDFDVYIRKGY